MADGYLGTTYPAPTDPNYYASQVGLSSLVPSAFNANTLAAMFAPQGLQYTPANNLATNPFLQLFMQQGADATKLQRRQVGGPAQSPGQQQTPGF